MNMSVLNAFCRLFNYIFVEEWQEKGTSGFSFIDFGNKRVRFSIDEIERMLARPA